MGILDKIVFCSGAFFNYHPARKEQFKKKRTVVPVKYINFDIDFPRSR